MAEGATRKARNTPSHSLAVVVGQRLLVAGSLLAVVALVGLVGWKLSKLPIERVVVSGELGRVSRDRLEAMVNDALHGGFLGADLDVIRRPLEELPWVYRVVIKRHWPSTLEIVVTEQLPIARWGQRGFLNHEGDVFLPETDVDVGELPSLVGPEGSQRRLMNYYKQIQQGMKLADLQLVSLSMNARGSVSARLADGLALEFGRGDLKGKLERFLGVYHADLAASTRRPRRVDLRYENGLAVAWMDS